MELVVVAAKALNACRRANDCDASCQPHIVRSGRLINEAFVPWPICLHSMHHFSLLSPLSLFSHQRQQVPFASAPNCSISESFISTSIEVLSFSGIPPSSRSLCCAVRQISRQPPSESQSVASDVSGLSPRYNYFETHKSKNNVGSADKTPICRRG